MSAEGDYTNNPQPDEDAGSTNVLSGEGADSISADEMGVDSISADETGVDSTSAEPSPDESVLLPDNDQDQDCERN